MTLTAHFLGRVAAIPALVALAALGLSGCGGSKDAAASQTAARVNKEDITVHQINFVLQQQRGLKQEQAEAATKQILERLIDQQLQLQKADEQKVEREPKVVQQIEAAKREIIARAYLEKVAEAATKPSAEEIKKYYDEKPALFKERRIYNIQEIAIEAKPEQVTALREKLGSSKNIGEFIEYLKAAEFKFAGNQAVRSAEQLPMQVVDAISRLKDGQAMVMPAANGAQVIVLAGSRSVPIDEAQATPVIELYLLNERKRKLIEDHIKSLRGNAKIEYIGNFVPGAGPASPAASAAAAPAAPPAATASAALSSDELSKGLGLKK